MSDVQVANLLDEFDYLNLEEINETIKIVNKKNLDPVETETLLKSMLRTKDTAAKKSQVLEAFPTTSILDDAFCAITRGTAGVPFFFPVKYTRPPSGFAVLIGCTYVGTLSHLKGSSHDVQSMYSMLRTVYNWGENDILVMTDVVSDTLIYPYHMIPTKANILKVAAALTEGAISGDSLFFYFSGHGGQTVYNEENYGELDGKDETIIACDHRIRPGDMSITDDVLCNLLCGQLPVGAKLNCVFDCCHSGTVLDLACYVVHGTYIVTNGFSDRRDILCISGCSDDALSYESWNGEEFQGALTRTLKAKLKKRPHYPAWELLSSINSTFHDDGQTQRATLCSPWKLDPSVLFAPVFPNPIPNN